MRANTFTANYLIFLFSFIFLNIGNLLYRYDLLPSISIYLVAVSFLMFFSSLRIERAFVDTFIWSSVFLVFLIIFGFVNYDLFTYDLIQMFTKLLIAMILFPLLIINLIDRMGFQNFLNLFYLLIGLSFIVLLIQFSESESLVPMLMVRSFESLGQRYPSLFVNPNIMGSIYLFALMLTILWKTNPTKKTIFQIMLISGLLISQSRTVFLNLIFFLGTLSFLRNSRTDNQNKLFTFALIAFLALIFISLGNAERIITYSEQLIFDKRIVFWVSTWESIKENLLFGLGHLSAERIVPWGAGVGPHNTFLWIICNSGIFPFIIYISFIIYILSKSIKKGMLHFNMIFLYFLMLMTNHDVLRSPLMSIIFTVAIYCLFSKRAKL